jgi:multidrug efflux system membrane fusion protein
MLLSRIIAFLIVAAAVVWVGSGVLGRAEQAEPAVEAEAEAPEPQFRVAFIDAATEEHARRIVLSGQTEADKRADAVARTTGSLVDLNVDRGSHVEKGATLAVLSDEAREAQVAQAQALVEQRQTDLDARLPLIERGLAPANERAQLEADLRAAQAALAQAEAQREWGNVIAPISGVVSAVPVSNGQALQPGTVVATIVALDPMLAVIEVPERQLGGVRVGERAGVRLVTGGTFEGSVRFISPTAATSTRTYRVDVELANPDSRIPDGVTCEVGLELDAVEAVNLPRSALTFTSEGALAVRIVDAEDKVASVAVVIIEDGGDTVWVSGPKDGDRVIVQGQDFVKDGQTVVAVPAQAAGSV